jgi:hypothetical protein
MVDNLHPDDGQLGPRRPEPAGTNRGDVVSDRQVSLGGDTHPALAVQQWLDGEGTETAARRASSRDVDLWERINEETARRGRMTTPAPVMGRIMAAIPDAKPVARAPWWGRPIALSPAALAGLGAGLLAVGAILGSLVK